MDIMLLRTGGFERRRFTDRFLVPDLTEIERLFRVLERETKSNSGF